MSFILGENLKFQATLFLNLWLNNKNRLSKSVYVNSVNIKDYTCKYVKV